MQPRNYLWREHRLCFQLPGPEAQNSVENVEQVENQSEAQKVKVDSPEPNKLEDARQQEVKETGKRMYELAQKGHIDFGNGVEAVAVTIDRSLSSLRNGLAKAMKQLESWTKNLGTMVEKQGENSDGAKWVRGKVTECEQIIGQYKEWIEQGERQAAETMKAPSPEQKKEQPAAAATEEKKAEPAKEEQPEKGVKETDTGDEKKDGQAKNPEEAEREQKLNESRDTMAKDLEAQLKNMQGELKETKDFLQGAGPDEFPEERALLNALEDAVANHQGAMQLISTDKWEAMDAAQKNDVLTAVLARMGRVDQLVKSGAIESGKAEKLKEAVGDNTVEASQEKLQNARLDVLFREASSSLENRIRGATNNLQLSQKEYQELGVWARISGHTAAMEKTIAQETQSLQQLHRLNQTITNRWREVSSMQPDQQRTVQDIQKMKKEVITTMYKQIQKALPDYKGIGEQLENAEAFLGRTETTLVAVDHTAAVAAGVIVPVAGDRVYSLASNITKVGTGYISVSEGVVNVGVDAVAGKIGGKLVEVAGSFGGKKVVSEGVEYVVRQVGERGLQGTGQFIVEKVTKNGVEEVADTVAKRVVEGLAGKATEFAVAPFADAGREEVEEVVAEQTKKTESEEKKTA